MECCIRGIPVYYEQYGSGKPVLCIHGYSVDHRIMTGCLEPVLAGETGCRRIYLDLPGMGRTPSAPRIQNADHMLEFLLAFIDAVIPPEESFLVVGESYGGYLTMGLIRSLRARIDGVMMICPGLFKNQSGKVPEKRLIWRDEKFDLFKDDADVEAFLNIAVMASPAIYEKYKADILPAIAVMDRDFFRQYGYWFSFDDELAEIEFAKPSTILAGRQDHIVGYLGAFEVFARFPRATFAVLDCAGHNLQIENEPLFNLHVKDWIERVGLNAGR